MVAPPSIDLAASHIRDDVDPAALMTFLSDLTAKGFFDGYVHGTLGFSRRHKRAVEAYYSFLDTQRRALPGARTKIAPAKSRRKSSLGGALVLPSVVLKKNISATFLTT